MEKTMRRLLFLIATMAFVAPSIAQTKDRGLSEITVSATSSVTTEPDIAEFRISIIARQRQATMAFKSYVRTYDALQASLKRVVDSTKLMTDNLLVTPFFDYKKPDRVTPEYYQVRASMSLSVPIPDLNRVLGSVTSVEGVTIDGIEFRAKDEEKLELRALNLAIMQAKEKAESAAKLEGMTDLRVKSMNTTTSRPPVMPMYGAMAAETAIPSVNASSVSVSATVNVTYTAESK
jgi:uncharacterized protein YggE